MATEIRKFDYASAELPIIDDSGAAISLAASVKSWLSLLDAPADAGEEAVSINEFIQEEHHKYYGRPWITGRLYFDYLVSAGVRPTDRVLDAGCGSGRVGIWLIPFLDEGRYFGVDAHLRSLIAFARYEAVLHHLADKKPRLMLSADFNVQRFDQRFDVVLDFSVTRNLPVARAEAAYRNIAAAMAPGGRVFSSTPLKKGEFGLSIEDMERLGFGLINSEKVQYSVFTETGSVQDIDHWHQFRRR